MRGSPALKDLTFYTSLEAADGLAICPEDEPYRDVGQQVVVQLLDWRDHAGLLTDTLDITTL